MWEQDSYCIVVKKVRQAADLDTFCLFSNEKIVVPVLFVLALMFTGNSKMCD